LTEQADGLKFWFSEIPKLMEEVVSKI